MSKEQKNPLQVDMFSGDLVDTRTRRQKELDKARDLPKQTEMFSQREIAQFGVNAHPLLPLSPNVKLLLIPEDPRTDEEKDRDAQRAAEHLTAPMFPVTAEPNLQETAIIQPDTKTLALVPCGAMALVVIKQVARAIIPYQSHLYDIRKS